LRLTCNNKNSAKTTNTEGSDDSASLGMASAEWGEAAPARNAGIAAGAGMRYASRRNLF
jgi:hypothetical protein